MNMSLRTPTTTPLAAGHADPDAPPALSPLGLVTLLVGTFLPMTDFFIVNVALPTIDHDLHASPGMLQLVVAGYGVAYAVLLVVGGRLGDAIGRRRLFIAGMAGFTLTSLACGLAPSIGLLVAGRALQGAASAMMLPQVLSSIQATTSGKGRARALGFYGATGGLAAVAGQLLGGVLVSADIAGTGWRPIFLVNVPVGVVGMVLAGRVIPETRSSAPAPVDRSGTAFLGATLLALLVPLTEGRSLGWPAWTVALLVVAPFLAAGFVRAERRLERRGGAPLVPMSVLAVPSMRRGLLLGLPFFAGFGGFMFVYALTLQVGAHFSALRTGMTLVPMALGFLAASLAMPWLVARFGRTQLTIGAAIQFCGLGGLAWALTAGWPHPAMWSLCIPSLACGVGQGMIMPPLFRIVLSEVPPALAGVGSGVLTTMQQTALGLGVATIGSLYLSASAHGGRSSLHASVLVLVILTAVAVVVGAASQALPREVPASSGAGAASADEPLELAALEAGV
ncbi:MFS transporter [Acidiferrimicrobium sp. IK]|nr:MFS transporter [Acidiferrimicrobium sp. IK]MCU4186582.1 MFS transporter [Acidiferrimicrobium sp. IK]